MRGWPETGLSASLAPRRTRVMCVLGEGDEEAGTLAEETKDHPG